MKKVFALFALAIVLISHLSSCSEIFSDENCDTSKIIDGPRSISVAFAQTAEFSLNGLQPVFNEGDEIMVSNGIECEKCVVKIENDIARIVTSLSGGLKAVYPYNAAKMNNKAIEGIVIPDKQSGYFKDANIAMSEVKANASIMTFSNKTTLFIITPPENVKQFKITSLKQVGSNGQRSGDAVAINTEPDNEAKFVVTVGNGESVLSTCYVCLASGVNLSDLSFDTGNAMKGIPLKDIKNGMNTTVTGTVYSINSSNWHPYVVIEGKKWATMNVGATTESENGAYFMWGEVSGHKPNGLTFDFSGFDHSDPRYPGESQWDPTYGFCWENVPYTNKVCEWPDGDVKAFTKYVSTSRGDLWNGIGDADNKTILDLCDDAAYANWGGSWRIPNRSEFFSLYNETWSESAVLSWLKFGTYGHYITLPVNGVGYYDECITNSGNYWTSDLDTSDPSGAFFFYFENSEPVGCESASRYYGMAVRPISD